MLADFQKTFKPTPEQIKESKEQFNRIVNQAYAEKWCSTCIHYIPVDENIPPESTAYPECELGGLAIDSCERYVSDGLNAN